MSFPLVGNLSLIPNKSEGFWTSQNDRNGDEGRWDIKGN